MTNRFFWITLWMISFPFMSRGQSLQLGLDASGAEAGAEVSAAWIFPSGVGLGLEYKHFFDDLIGFNCTDEVWARERVLGLRYSYHGRVWKQLFLIAKLTVGGMHARIFSAKADNPAFNFDGQSLVFSPAGLVAWRFGLLEARLGLDYTLPVFGLARSRYMLTAGIALNFNLKGGQDADE